MPDMKRPGRADLEAVALRSAVVIVSTAAFTWIDQISKDWAFREFRFGGASAPPTNLLRFTCHMNQGTAWGFCSGGHWYGLPVVVLIIGVVLAAVMALAAGRQRGGSTSSVAAGQRQSPAGSAMMDAVAFSLLVSGALGNALDRFRRGSVIDFIDVGIGTTRWPTFNVADACLVVGIYLVLTGALADLMPHQDGHSDKGGTPPSRVGIFAGIVVTAAIAAAIMAAVGHACETSLAVHQAVVALLSWLGIGVAAVLLYGYVRMEMRRVRRPDEGGPPPGAET
jgi:signal peptidase II